MKVNLKGVSAGTKRQGSGIADVTITGAAFGESTVKKTPYVEVTTENATGATHSDQFYLSPGALPRLRHLLEDGLGYTSEQLDRDLTEDQMKALLVGKKVRLKFSGEEYVRKDQTIGMKTTLGFGNFAENIKTPADKTALTFSEDRDIKKAVAETAGDDPF